MNFNLEKIKLKSVLHYFLIYLMFIIPGSNFYDKVIPDKFHYIIFGILFLVTIAFKKFRNLFTLIPVVIIGFFGVFVRAMSGGIGLYSIISLSLPLLIINIAFLYDKDKFLSRFINVAIFFFSISLVCYCIQILNSSIFTKFLYKYQTVAHGTDGYETYEYGFGFLLYSFMDVHPTRNCGIFTEPGVYQIIINAVILSLLFFKNNLKISNIKYYFALIISVIVLITGKSTTGFISLAVILLFYLLFYKKKNVNIFKFLVSLILIGVILILSDYLLRGKNSIIYSDFISKLFADGSVSVKDGTGKYRLFLIETSFKSIANNPLGIGYNNFNSLLEGTGASGAGVFMFGAVYGLIPFAVILFWMLYPYLITKRYFFMLLFLIIFINTASAQTYIFYPGLFIISYLILFNEKKYMRRNNI